MFKILYVGFIFGSFISSCVSEVIDLGGDDWTFSNYDGSINGKASVPGNIYQDLQNNGIINLNDAYSDVNTSWVSSQSWIYTRKFNVSTSDTKLVMKSLDTVGYLELNENNKFAFFDNMFIKKEVYLNEMGVYVDRENSLKIVFMSPVEFVNERAKRYKKVNGFKLPPSTLPQEYHGVDHANFMRKMQASFSWDWGRQLVTSGIVNKIYLQTSMPFDIESTMVDTIRVESTKNWLLRAKIYLRLNSHVRMMSVFRFYLNDEEIKLDQKNTKRPIVGKTGYMVLNEFELGPFSNDQILPWFPNKFDFLQENLQEFKPNLYNFTVCVENRDGLNLIDKKSFAIGFREIKLIEQPLKDGRSFYFNINGIPFFARGINYIPTTLNVGNLTEHTEKFTYLLHQVKESNMNMIRVWGGGLYETDEFYDLADKLGILIWQDFMYACAMYEADYKHLESAKDEVIYQVRRLQRHPSIAVFAGNNEIEGALSTGWWDMALSEKSKTKLESDYIKLFEETIRYTVTNLTTSIPFVASSPTNNDGQVFVDTTNFRKGDIHFYDYGPDCLNVSKYPRARFVSEYGFQSYPSISTFAKSISTDRLIWPLTNEIEHRQHAPEHNMLISQQLVENFHFKSVSSLKQDIKEFEEYTYLTQVLQALSIKLEAERYLSDRDENLWQDEQYSLSSSVENLNMGSLIWQLNDVWQAPTWSSIDYDGNYKILQYYIKKFYNLAHVVATKEDDQLVITLINDSLRKVKIKYYVIFYRNENGYLEPSPVETVQNEVELDKLSVFKQQLDLNSKTMEAGCDRPESCFVRIDYSFFNQYLENFYLLGKPVELNLKPVEVKSRIVKLPAHQNNYVVIVSSEKVALFVELSWTRESNIEGHFIDNGFNLLKEEKYILFEAKKEFELKYLEDNLQIRTINKYTS